MSGGSAVSMERSAARVSTGSVTAGVPAGFASCSSRPKSLFSALDQLDGDQPGAGHPGGHVDHVGCQVHVLQPGVPVFGRRARWRLLIEYLQSSHHAAGRETTPVVELRERLGNGPAWHCLVERDESARESKRRPSARSYSPFDTQRWPQRWSSRPRPAP